MRRLAAAWIAFVFAAAACARGSVDSAARSTDIADAGAADSAAPSNEIDATTPGADSAAPPVEDASNDAAPAIDAPAEDAPIDDAGLEAAPPDAGHGTIPIGAALGSCDPARWTITATSSYAVNPPKYLNDGLPPTRWSSGAPQSPGQYVQIDFGGYVLLEEIHFDSSFTTTDRADYARAFDVLASDDGATFNQTITSKSFAQDPGPVTSATFAPYATRAIRVALTATSTAWWTAHEIGAKCTRPAPDDAGADAGYDAAPSGPSLGRTGWSATANFTSTTTSDPVTGAIDGNASTRWASGKLQFGDEWFRLDLGSAVSVSQVWLTSNATDYPSAYSLEVSTDDVAYTEVATGLGEPTTKIAFGSQTARYLRIKQIGSGYPKWWCIYETAVYP